MRTMLVTGCEGFIGSEACRWYKDKGYYIVGIDVRPHQWLLNHADDYLHEFHQTSVRHIRHLPLGRPDVVLHLAAQVSVTRSLTSPESDFETNAQGTFNLALWAKRLNVPTFIYASTNKIFGELKGYAKPIRDDQPIAPQTPYGISKATGGLYVLDLLPKKGFVFAQSCIYGASQKGSIDQGWVAWLRRSLLAGRPITCYGNGSQVRDLLDVRDLLKAYDFAIERKIEPGQYVVGGGSANAHSFVDVVDRMGGTIADYDSWRPHDQRYFVSASNGLREVGWTGDYLAIDFLASVKQELTNVGAELTSGADRAAV